MNDSKLLGIMTKRDGVILKKYLGVIICVILVLTAVSCSNKHITNLTYSGEAIEWEAKAEYNPGGNYYYTIKYLGNDKKTFKFNFNIEYLSGNISGGVGEYSDLVNKVGGLTLKFENDLINGDIKKYGNKNDLYIQIDWDNKTETINLKKDDAL